MQASLPSHHVAVYEAEDFRVSSGVKAGEPLSCGAELLLDDVYFLDRDAVPNALPFWAIDHGDAIDRLSDGVERRLLPDCVIALMALDGRMVEAVVLVEPAASGMPSKVRLYPCAPLMKDTEYVLIGIDLDAAHTKLAQLGCACFAAGTHVTLANGAQQPIEALKAGDLVLTRDHGGQPVKWIGKETHRATGSFAPVRIDAGVLNNAEPLTVSRANGVFIYQRRDMLGNGRAEVLIKAEQLINGGNVIELKGGFVEMFYLLFEDHQIIYAEGIAVESMRMNRHSHHVLPASVLDALPRGSAPTGIDHDIVPPQIEDLAERLRLASAG